MYRYYEIPTISAINAFVPLYQFSRLDMPQGFFGGQGPLWQENHVHTVSAENTTLNNMYTIRTWHADGCCHPGPFGHDWLAMVLLYNLEKEMEIMDAVDREAVLNEDRFDGDFSAFHLKGPTEKLREFWID